MSPKNVIVATVALAVLGAAGWFGWKRANRTWRPQSVEVTTPKAAVAALKGPTVLFLPNARPFLEKSHPDFFPSGTRDAFSEESRRFTQAGQDARLFRELDRTHRFPEIWLLGEPSYYKALLEHLLETKDFGVTYVDHTSIILRRGAGETWQPGDPERESKPFADPKERAYFLAQYAARLIALHRPDAATRWLELAEKTAAEVPEVWSAWSTHRMAKGDWDEAVKYADRALSIDENFVPGIACKAQCLYAAKKFHAAFDLSTRLLKSSPDDAGILFYHAKLAHEARAYEAEIDALQRLIALAEKAKANVSGYRVYLAQAYAAQGDADSAMDQVTLALLDTTLPREQRKFADELLTQIKKAK
jgi:tetratricopeptide (TPR) repeat protein